MHALNGRNLINIYIIRKFCKFYDKKSEQKSEVKIKRSMEKGKKKRVNNPIERGWTF